MHSFLCFIDMIAREFHGYGRRNTYFFLTSHHRCNVTKSVPIASTISISSRSSSRPRASNLPPPTVLSLAPSMLSWVLVLCWWVMIRRWWNVPTTHLLIDRATDRALRVSGHGALLWDTHLNFHSAPSSFTEQKMTRMLLTLLHYPLLPASLSPS